MKDRELFEIENDPDTAKFLEIVLWNLQRFFYCQGKQAGIDLINKFIAKESEYIQNDFHFEDGAFRVAAKIYYLYVLEGKKNNFIFWLKDNNLVNNPREAIEYFRRNYYK